MRKKVYANKNSGDFLWSTTSGSRGKYAVDSVERFSSSNSTWVQGKDGKFRKKKIKRNFKRSKKK